MCITYRLGWTEAAMIAGARVVGVSPAIIGSFPRKEAALVEVFFFIYSALIYENFLQFWILLKCYVIFGSDFLYNLMLI